MPESENRVASEVKKIGLRELITLYEALYERYWDKERGAFKDPITVARSLLSYGCTAAMRLAEANARIDALAARLAALEAFRQEIETQGAEIQKQMEAALAAAAGPVFDGSPATQAESTSAASAPTAPAAVPTLVSSLLPSDEAPVVPIKPASSSKKQKGGDAV